MFEDLPPIPFYKKIINSCHSLFKFMDMTWSTLDHKKSSMNAGPLHSAGFLTDMYCALVILPNNEFEQLEKGNRHLAFFAGNQTSKNMENRKPECSYRFINRHQG